MISSTLLLDSVNPAGCRLSTWILTYPRFFHSELMTHRVFSRNAASSRAIPVKKVIEEVKNNPAVPTFWGKNQSGMQASQELEGSFKELSQAEWLKARDSAVQHAQKMLELGLHKQVANRILEPFMHMTIILTGTEFENFFSLRAHKDAQPEFQELAYNMLSMYESNEPKKLKEGEWHIPFSDKLDMERLMVMYQNKTGKHYFKEDEDMTEIRLKISTARCARVSYLNFEGKDDYNADVELCNILSSSGHWSPFEHCAQSLSDERWSGNFKGWKQYRKFFDQENRRDPRIKNSVGCCRALSS
jgi:thymidylate synthase ThyX